MSRRTLLNGACSGQSWDSLVLCMQRRSLHAGCMQDNFSPNSLSFFNYILRSRLYLKNKRVKQAIFTIIAMFSQNNYFCGLGISCMRDYTLHVRFKCVPAYMQEILYHNLVIILCKEKQPMAMFENIYLFFI